MEFILKREPILRTSLHTNKFYREIWSVVTKISLLTQTPFRLLASPSGAASIRAQGNALGKGTE